MVIFTPLFSAAFSQAADSGIPHTSMVTPRTPPDAGTLARRAIQIAPKGNWLFTANLATRAKDETAPSGAQEGERPLTVEYRKLTDGTRQVTYKSSEKDTREGVRIVLPKKGAISLVDLSTNKPVKNLQNRLFQSVFTMEDISLRFLSWPEQKLTGEETLRDRRCWILVSHPPEGDTSSYAWVESWIDQQYQGVLRALAYNAQGDVVKEFTVRSFQKIEDLWTLKLLEIQAPLEKTRTRLEILDAREISEAR